MTQDREPGWFAESVRTSGAQGAVSSSARSPRTAGPDPRVVPSSPDDIYRALADDPMFLAMLSAAEPRRRINWGGFWLGLIVCLIAVGVSLSMFDHATKYGGSYVVFWGAAVWGGWKALKSLFA